MARIRTVKPEFWTSSQVADCSPTTRLLFIGLWNFCDDNGIHPFNAKRIKMEIFPADCTQVAEIEAMLLELIHSGLIKTYVVELQRYLVVTGWHHQKIEKPNYKHPAPDENTKFDDWSPTNRQPVGDPSPPEGKGRESIGVENKSMPAKKMSLSERMLRDCMEEKRGMLAGKFPLVDLDLELEEMVSKYRGMSIGADAFLIISRWLKNLPEKQRADPSKKEMVL